MRVSVFGLGYVGSVTAACLAREGHEVIGVDVDTSKLEMLAAGRAPVIESGLEEAVSRVVASGALTLTSDARIAVEGSDVSLVCVGTPGRPSGEIDLTFVDKVCAELGTLLAGKDGHHVVVIRSTVLPGTTRNRVIPLPEETSGLEAGLDFGVAMNPEFLREGSAIADFYRPSVTLIGTDDHRSGAVVAELYETVNAPVIRTQLEIAEMAKYASNAFHALKVTFANEIGNLSKHYGIDGREVMDILCGDTELNISPAYLRPGFAFGGSCLPKDTRALAHQARRRDAPSPLLEAIVPSNEAHIQRAIQLVEATGLTKVGILGLSFKAGTDDLRESPIVPLIETLVGRGYQVTIFDEQVKLSRLIGSNKSYIDREVPHIASLMRPTFDEVVLENDVIVVANASGAFNKVPELIDEHQVLIDLVGLEDTDRGLGRYEGICW